MTTVTEASFPKLVCCTKIDVNEDIAEEPLYDVKFWPYELSDKEQIFAVVGAAQAFVCRTVTGGTPPYEILRWWHNEQKEASANSVAWIKEPESGKPLLAISGIAPRHIAIIDISTGQVVRELVDHGQNVNELLVSPTAPNILASCSEDFTIRLWNLDKKYAKSPCVAIIAGQGHKQPLLSMAWHPNGRWLLSGSMDTAVGLWSVPDSKSLAPENANDEPVQVHWPHFFSQEVHHNYVDSLAFYGDYIISRSAQQQSNVDKPHEILLWKIDGFRADADPPEGIDISQPAKQTRSSFPHSRGSQGFQRLLSFNMPASDRFYLRFGLFFQPGLTPMLCMANVKSKYCFWNLEKLEDQIIIDTSTSGASSKALPHKKGIARKRKAGDASSRSSKKQVIDGSIAPSPLRRFDGDESVTSSDAGSLRRDVLEDPFHRIKPHYSFTANTEVVKKFFATFTTTWSPDGHWVVGVADFGVMVMMYREKVT